MKLSYHLAQSCHNTFIIYDCLDQTTTNAQMIKEAHKSLQREGCDDALLLVNGLGDKHSLSAEMVVVGLDGKLGEFCGNGARCCAAYLFKHCQGYDQFVLKSASAEHTLQWHGGDIYSVELPLPRFSLNAKFIRAPQPPLVYVEMIEPHLIHFGEMSDAELTTLGRQLNQQPDLFPLGINVNAWHVIGNDTLFVKTYERGVQRLTKACGTGSLSCAAYFRKQAGQVLVNVPGGHLNIEVKEKTIQLKGAAYCNA